MSDVVLMSEAFGTAAVAAVCLVLLCAWPWRSPRPRLRAIGEVLGIGCGVFLGCLILGVEVKWPPREDQDRFLLILLPALIGVELLAAQPEMPRWLAWLFRLSLAVSAGRILLDDSIYLQASQQMSSGEGPTLRGWELLAVLAAALALVWTLLATWARRSSGRWPGLALAFLCGGGAAAVMLSGYATGGQLGMPMAGAIFGASAASLLLPTPKATPPALSMGVVLLFSLLVMGHFFGDLTTTHAAVLFFTPLLCLLVAIPPLPKLRAWAQALVLSVLIAVPVGMVVSGAYHQFTIDMQSVPSADDSSAPDFSDVYGK